ncbi:hypothetical protein EZV62_001407 [Acer yangbiense]|uniref:Uncharacterized protein n=1 Tax=Acer yangbiense TaxID=1000413 RepID=A0A5C7IUQ5_9ROSI|nr:hypothetical protein EZV62_001407 [Acer yangbiense]
MKDFQPLSLCSVVYKIVTKTLAKRLKEALSDIIELSQSAIVPGRLIFDNASISFELFHSLNNIKKGKVGWATIKVDLMEIIPTNQTLSCALICCSGKHITCSSNGNGKREFWVRNQPKKARMKAPVRGYCAGATSETISAPKV